MPVVLYLERHECHAGTGKGLTNSNFDIVPPMSKLPPELWRNIFSLAVNEPISFLREWDSRYWAPPAATDMRMKLTICRVCRLFHGIGTELLYTHIYFPRHSFDGIDKIATVFERHQHEVGYAYGRATKRIDIWAECLESRLEVLPLLRLLKLVQNLVVLAFRTYTFSTTIPIFDPSALSQVSRLLEQRFKHCFKCLALCISLSSLYGKVLPEIPLHMLELAMVPCHLDPHPCTTNVTSLILNLLLWPEENDPLMWHFPSLKSLTLRSMTVSDMPRLEPFFQLHGQHIMFLNILYFKGQRNVDHITHFLKVCPRIHHFSFPSTFLLYHEELNGGVWGPQIFSGVNTVSIEHFRSWSWSASIFRTIHKVFPNLERIRHTFNDRGIEPGALRLMRRLEASGIKMEPVLIGEPTLASEDILADCMPGLLSEV